MMLARWSVAIAAGTVSLSVMACQAQAPVGLGSRGQDLVVAETSQAAHLIFKLKDNTPKAPSGYHVSYVYAPDWHTASITLYRNMNGADTLVRSATVAATTRSDETGREGTTSFNSLEPGGGYKVAITLTGKNPDGSDFTVASGTSANQTINAGNNTINVTLKQVGSKLQPVISQAELTPDTIAASTGTQEAFTLKRLAGKRWAAGWVGGFGGTTDPTDANLRTVRGMTSDPAGNVYVAQDDGYPCILKLPADGSPAVIIAGTGVDGDGATNEIATTQKIGAPFGLEFDATNNRLYFADSSVGKIRYVDFATGRLITYAGGGATALTAAGTFDRLSAKLGRVASLRLDDNGDIYFTHVNKPAFGAVRGSPTRVWRLNAATGKINQVIDLASVADVVVTLPLALDKANDRLYVPTTSGSTGLTYIRLITGITGSASVSNVANSMPMEDWQYISALDFDQSRYLYAMQSGTSDKDTVTPGYQGDFPYNDASVKVWRMPVDLATGKLQSGYSRVRIAGTGDANSFNDTAAVEAPLSAANAGKVRLTGASILGLAVDRYKVGAGVPATVYLGNSCEGLNPDYTQNWGQVVKLESP